ncbi:MAG: hypothetical protein ACR2JD_02840 [Nocardioides sp.]
MGPELPGCESWYLDEHGRNTVLWPRSTVTFRRLTESFDAAAYDATLSSQQVSA